MALEIRQQLKLSQQLVMTPQLQQAIKLLQLSRMELMDVVREELEENPVLEEGQETPEEKAQSEEELAAENTDEAAPEALKEIEGDGDGMADIDWKTYLESYSLGGTTADSYEDDEDRPSYENLLTKKPSLTDHLMWQLGLSRLENREREVAAEIIGNVDDDGYLQVSIEELSAQIGCDPEQAEKVLTAVQDF
ncbi:MAG: RNA polymerase sigma-54 factor, partial [Desulfuromonadales bacterium]|nr:RNA polymerase sigma-54 factor [Desulfuromonadales bacterium]